MTHPSVLHLDTGAGWRGGQRQVLLLARALSAHGHRVAVASPPTAPLAGAVRDSALASLPWPARGEWDLAAARAVRREAASGAWDLVHAHTSHAHALARLALRGSCVPLVVTRRVDFPVGTGLLGRWKYGEGVARFIAVSSAVAEVLARGRVARDRIDVVRSGVPDLPRPAQDRFTLRASLGVAARQPMAVWVGHFADHKDPATLVRAAALLRRSHPQVALVMVGQGELFPRVARLVHELDLATTVLLAGAREDVPDLLRAADACVISSHLEGLSTTALDAALAGLPVVATRVGGLPEAVAHGRTGLLVPSRDPEALAAALDAVLSDPRAAALLGAAGRERVLDEFSVEAMVRGNQVSYRRALALARVAPQGGGP